MCNCFTCDCKCSKCVLLLLWRVYVYVTCSFVSMCVSLMWPEGLSGHARLCVCSFFLCINMLECVFLWYMSGIGICVVYVGGCMDPHGHGAKGTLPGTSCPMVSEGLLFHWWSCTKK